ncbi:STAS domain-containing protein [Parathalassolituus penaei]|uniref:STAS domain-containing protein n=1 Tax=Parathalassolituus penaei TaxID=2997323 RepID=A0A9X3EF32_9GAMM|nr:STAS domain-containing protein [Parathalassolituus penaei]MCY0965560.1 STAS domain-containing protein [Parathalassolituus penaei]
MAALQSLNAGQANLSGDLLADTVVPVLEAGRDLIARSGGQWTVNMSAVERVSSVGVALLLDWIRTAEKAGVTLRIEALPDHLRPIIQVSDLDELFAAFCTPA